MAFRLGLVPSLEMSPKSSEAWDRVVVGAFWGCLAGLAMLGVGTIWALLSRPGAPPWKRIIALHAGYVLLYVLAGALVGFLWPLRRTMAGRWLLWFLPTATGAISVNSSAYGAPWEWSLIQWGHYAVVAIFFTPVFACPSRRGKRAV